MSEEITKPVSEETPAETKASEKSAPAKAAEPERRAPAQQRPRPAPRGRQSRARRAKVCQFCVEKTDYIDYKKPELLLPYISPYGKMLSRRRTGVCARHQRRLAVAIKRARFLALLPYTAEHIRRYGS
jgi:small subunit ribosomal protein S18